MSIVLLVGTQGLLQQARNDLVVWSEAHQEKWATNEITTQKKKKKKKTTRHIHSQNQGCPEGNLCYWCEFKLPFLSPVVICEMVSI